MTPRQRRRAVGPPGARPAVDEPRVEDDADPERVPVTDDDERFRSERPPHHDQER